MLDYSINPGTTVMIYNGGLFYDDIYELAIGENPNLYFQYYNTVIGYEYENVDTYLVSDTLNVNVPGYYYREYVADEPNSGLYLIFRIIFKVGTPGDFNLIQLNYDQNWLDKLASYDIILYGTSKNVSITYDNQGNPITIHNFKYKGNYYSSANLEWDGRELREIEIPSANITIKYLYDDQGYRINKTIINGSQVQSIDYTLSQGKVIYETDGTYSIIYTYDYDGTLISFNYDNNIHDSITGKDYFYVRNLQGDITAIVNHTGNIVAEYKYDAWGNIIYSTDNEIARINPYTYRGYGYDIETGLYYLNSRYYNPEIGRFINADTTDVLTASPMALTVDPWAWAGLAGDALDLIPFVTGVGEVTRAVKTTVKVVDKADDVVDAAKVIDKVSDIRKATGSYEIIFKSGKNYVGKAGFNRAIKSAHRYGDDVATSIMWKSAPNKTAAFIDEFLMQDLKRDGRGVNNMNTYNKIWSPGKRLLGR